ATVAGTFAFATPATAPGAGTANYAVTFTPTDTANYDPTSVQVSVTVDKATPVITTAPVAAAITYGETLAEATLSGGVATVAGTFAFASPATAPDAGTADHAVTFTPTDTANFNTTSVQVSVTVDKATPTITTAPVAAAITYGETLAEATLSGGTATVAGTFAFASPATAPGAGTANHAVTFTPTETANYNTTSVQVSVPVDKATPTIMTAPVAAAITYGETLAEAFLSGGAATVAGTFAFTSPATAPDAGTADHAVTFTPTDTSNYNPATVQVSVTVTENFAFWIGGFDGVGELTGPTDDPDCDGVKNLMEYALAGGDPGDCDSSILPVVSTVLEGNQEYLAITERKNPSAAGVSWVVEVSGDLGDWNAGAGHTVIVSETADTLVVRDHTPMADTNGRFLRLRVVPGQP
ncbi:MAG: hypothetical protein K9M97_12990, partial [Akkermansiaceae bacterium]|nr:hypothetical protein [Akkermansiaceae bacterium]